MNDADFLRAILEKHPGQWVRHIDILNESFRERGCGLTVHSRAATLRERGLVVECRTEKNEVGRLQSFYRLGGLDGGNGAGVSAVPTSSFPPSSPSGSTSGGAGGLAAASAAEAPAPPEDGDDGSTPWLPPSPEDAAADSPSPHSGSAAAQPSLFDMPAVPSWG